MHQRPRGSHVSVHQSRSGSGHASNGSYLNLSHAVAIHSAGHIKYSLVVAEEKARIRHSSFSSCLHSPISRQTALHHCVGATELQSGHAITILAGMPLREAESLSPRNAADDHQDHDGGARRSTFSRLSVVITCFLRFSFLEVTQLSK
jgi:hypothetical protein